MNIVKEFVLGMTDYQQIDLPDDVEILDTKLTVECLSDITYEEIILLARLEDNHPTLPRGVFINRSGEMLGDDQCIYCGSFQSMESGGDLFHVFLENN